MLFEKAGWITLLIVDPTSFKADAVVARGVFTRSPSYEEPNHSDRSVVDRANVRTPHASSARQYASSNSGPVKPASERAASIYARRAARYRSASLGSRGGLPCTFSIRASSEGFVSLNLLMLFGRHFETKTADHARASWR